MEVIEIKKLFIFIIVTIIWFVASFYDKNRKSQKKQTKPQEKPIPNIFEEVVREFKKEIEEQVASESSPQHKHQTIKKTDNKSFKKEIPEEVLAAQIRKTEREKALKNSPKKQIEETEKDSILLGGGYFQYNDLQKMVIFTEIFNRPKY